MGLPFTRGITMANNASVAAKSNPQLGGIVPPKNTPAIDITFHTSQHIVLTPAKYQSCCRVPSRFTRSKRGINNTNPISLIENPNNVRLPKERCWKYGCKAAPKSRKRIFTTVAAANINQIGGTASIKGKG